MTTKNFKISLFIKSIKYIHVMFYRLGSGSVYFGPELLNNSNKSHNSKLIKYFVKFGFNVVVLVQCLLDKILSTYSCIVAMLKIIGFFGTNLLSRNIPILIRKGRLMEGGCILEKILLRA